MNSCLEVTSNHQGYITWFSRVLIVIIYLAIVKIRMTPIIVSPKLLVVLKLYDS